MDDPVVASFRERISAADDEVLAAVNHRLRLVSELHAHKRAHGYPLFDAGRERNVVERAIERNGGPLSDEGVRALYNLLLPLCTSEAARLGEEAAPA
jgi:chorismate mutase / prephenate dehydratase